MSNEKDQLVGNILQLNNVQLTNIKKSSYLNGVYSFESSKEVMKNYEEDYYWEKERKELMAYLDGALLLLKKGDKDSLSKVKDMKKELLLVKGIVESYIVELSVLGEVIDEYGMKILAREKYTNVKVDPREVDKLIFRIEGLLNANKDNYNQYIYIISEIIRALPLRITKDNYYHILSDTITRNLLDYNNKEVDYLIGNYKKLFDGSIRDGYGTKFDHFFVNIEKMKKIDLEDKSFDELAEVVEDLIILTDELNDINNLIKTIGLGLNMVISYLSIDISLDMGDYEVSSSMGDKSKLLKEISKVEKDILANAEKFEKLQEEAFFMEEFEFEQLEEELTKTQKILSYYNDIDFTDINFEDNFEDNYLENSIEGLIDYINRSIKTKSNLERRIRMRKLLAEIELPFKGIVDFKDYIKYSLDYRIIKEEEMAFKLDQINYFISELEKLN